MSKAKVFLDEYLSFIFNLIVLGIVIVSCDIYILSGETIINNGLVKEVSAKEYRDKA